MPSFYRNSTSRIGKEGWTSSSARSRLFQRPPPTSNRKLLCTVWTSRLTVKSTLYGRGENFFSHFSVFRKTTPVAADRRRGANISPFPSPQASFSSVRFSTEGGTFFQLFCVRKEDERKRRRRKKPAADVFEIGRNLGGIRQ